MEEWLERIGMKLNPLKFPHLGRRFTTIIQAVLKTFTEPRRQIICIDDEGMIWKYRKDQVNFLGELPWAARRWARFIGFRRVGLTTEEHQQAEALFKIFTVYWKYDQGDHNKLLRQVFRNSIEDAKRIYSGPKERSKLAAALTRERMEALKAA